METLFTHLPDHLLTPAFKAQCDETVMALNDFMRRHGLNPDSVGNLASFMRKTKLSWAYCDQAEALGLPTLNLNDMVWQDHSAAVAGFLADGGRLYDLTRCFSVALDRKTMLTALISGGFRGLHANMGLIESPEATAITMAFASKLFSMWTRKELEDFSRGQMFMTAPAKTVCLQYALGLTVSHFHFELAEIEALACFDPELFDLFSTTTHVVGITGSLGERLRPIHAELERSYHRLLATDTDDLGLIARTDLIGDVLPALLEVPVFIMLRDAVAPDLIWRDILGRCLLMTRRMLDPAIKHYLSTAIALGVVQETSRFHGLPFAAPLLLEQQRMELERQWRDLTLDRRQLCSAFLNCLETKAQIDLPDCEKDPRLQRRPLRACLSESVEHSSANQLPWGATWSAGVAPHLWPELIAQRDNIVKAAEPSKVVALLAANTWAIGAKCFSSADSTGTPLYCLDDIGCDARLLLTSDLAQDPIIQRATLKTLHEHGLLNEDAIFFLNWNGNLLNELDFEVSAGVQAAMLESDLGL
jgi:hypothetical protein